MTLEEMIQSLMLATNVSEVERNKRIIAALKAGQAMYEAPAVDPVDGYTSSKMMRAKKQWKAATDGDNK